MLQSRGNCAELLVRYALVKHSLLLEKRLPVPEVAGVYHTLTVVPPRGSAPQWLLLVEAVAGPLEAPLRSGSCW